PDGCELAVRAVLGQQVSVTSGTRLVTRIVAELGTPLAHPVGAVTHAFPTAAAIAELDPDALPMPRSRARTLVGMAAELAAGRLVLDDTVDRAETYGALRALRGIGPWTAGYIGMRALRDPDAFITGLPSPVGDLLLAGDGDELSGIWIDGQRWAPEIGADWRIAAEPFAEATRQLREYFAGARTTFMLALRRTGTPFQNEVWGA